MRVAAAAEMSRTAFVRRCGATTFAWLARGPVIGALHVGGITARSIVDARAAGIRSPAQPVDVAFVRAIVASVARTEITVLALGIALGIALGWVAERLARWRDGVASARAVDVIFLVVLEHAALVAWAMAHHPDRYAAWYAAGGARRTALVLVTDTFGATGSVALLLVAAALHVSLPRLRRRMQALEREPLGSPAPRVTSRSPAASRSSGASRSPGASTLVAAAIVAAGIAALVVTDRGTLVRPPLRTTAPPAARDDRPDIVLVVVDSLRADRLDPRVMPNLARLAARGTTFDHAFVTLPQVLPSWATLLTGREPHDHGIRSPLPAAAPPLDALPGRLRSRGYRVALVGDDALEELARIDVGFGPSARAESSPSAGALFAACTPMLPILGSAVGYAIAPEMRVAAKRREPLLVAEDARAALRSAGGPVFLAAVLSAARAPIAAVAGSEPSGRRSYRGPYKYLGPAVEGVIAAEDIEHVRYLYDGAVRSVDDAIGRIVRDIEVERSDRERVVVVIGNRGKRLFDHGRGGEAGEHLFGDEGTHVPLVVFDSRRQVPRRAGDVVRDTDVAPALGGYAEGPYSEEPGADGHAIPFIASALRREAGGGGRADVRGTVPAARPPAAGPVDPRSPRRAYSETGPWLEESTPDLAPELRIPYPGGHGLVTFEPGRTNATIRPELEPTTTVARHRSVRDERYKLVYVPTRGAARYFLFDTVADPGELHDVAREHPAELERLSAHLWSWMLEDPAMTRAGDRLVPKLAHLEAAHGPRNVVWIVADDGGEALSRALSPRGARFTNAYASATDPTNALASVLVGARPSELAGLDASAAFGGDAVTDSPLLPRILERHGLAVQAFVTGRSSVPGFAAAETEAASPIASNAPLRAATTWITANARGPFFAFVDLSSSPPADDDALSALLTALDASLLTERTLVVLSGPGAISSRAAAPRDRSSRVPLVIVAPGMSRPNVTVAAAVRTIDIVPTILDATNLEPAPVVSGRSLRVLASGAEEASERVVLVEGISTRALVHDRWKLVVPASSGATFAPRLFDQVVDPEGRRDLAAARAEVLAEMVARFTAAAANQPVAGSPEVAPTAPPHPVLHLRFVGGSVPRRVAGTIHLGAGRSGHRSAPEVRPIELGHDDFRLAGTTLEVAFRTRPEAPVGFDIVLDPSAVPVTWELWLDDERWPDEAVFAGPFGFRASLLRNGLANDEARALARSNVRATIDPRRETGLFIERSLR